MEWVAGLGLGSESVSALVVEHTFSGWESAFGSGTGSAYGSGSAESSALTFPVHRRETA